MKKTNTGNKKLLARCSDDPYVDEPGSNPRRWWRVPEGFESVGHHPGPQGQRRRRPRRAPDLLRGGCDAPPQCEDHRDDVVADWLQRSCSTAAASSGSTPSGAESCADAATSANISRSRELRRWLGREWSADLDHESRVGKEVSVVAADPQGRFEVTLDAGEYALAVSGERAFGWVETVKVPDLDAKLDVFADVPRDHRARQRRCIRTRVSAARRAAIPATSL